MAKLRKADPQAIQDNLGLVFHMKEQFKYLPDSRLDWGELLSWGTEGLAFALGHFDPSKGRKFSTYACICIRGFMLKGIQSLSREIRRAKSKGLVVSNVSLSAMPEHLWPSYAGHEKIEHDIDVSKQIEQVLNVVPSRTREVVEFTFAHPEMTHQEIGEHFGIGRSTVGLAWNNTIRTGKKLWKVDGYKEAA
jgi:RNA polymerase sigma factor (sigma-70 family)